MTLLTAAGAGIGPGAKFAGMSDPYRTRADDAPAALPPGALLAEHKENRRHLARPSMARRLLVWGVRMFDRIVKMWSGRTLRLP
jgi:hypothetical protein